MKKVKKGWGYELWIVNKPEYCGKLLYLEKGKRCALHYHKKKDETLYLHSGKLQIIEYSLKDRESTYEKILFSPGQALHIPPGTVHQLIAIDISEIYEFSTQHFDSDSYFIDKGDE